MLPKKITVLLVIFCILKLTVHLIADVQSGFQGDEFLHIETGNHIAFGYMEFPPVIGWLAFLQNKIGSNAVWAQHIFTHLAGILIFILATLTTYALGGRTKAVGIVLLCLFAAPAFGRGHQLFQPVVFSQLTWLLAFYQLVRFAKTHQQKYLGYLTLSLALGFLTKYDILFFMAGLMMLLFFTSIRKNILTKQLGLYILLFFILIAPNLIWQYQHGFPVLDMFGRLYQTQLNKLSPTEVFIKLLISLNPLTLFFWLSGFVFMFTAKRPSYYKPIAACLMLTIGLLIITKSKDYYFFAAFIFLILFGSIWFEQKILAYKNWIFYPTAGLLFISGCLLMPYSLAVLRLPAFIKYAHLKAEGNRLPVPYAEYYAPIKWNATLTALKEVYEALPEKEKETCLIWGKHYSQAGAVNLFRKEYQLPKAFSYHGSFYLWAPTTGSLPTCIIAYSNQEAGADFFESFFDEVAVVRKVYHRYAFKEKDLWETIYLCRKPKVNFQDLKKEFSTRVFE